MARVTRRACIAVFCAVWWSPAPAHASAFAVASMAVGLTLPTAVDGLVDITITRQTSSSAKNSLGENDADVDDTPPGHDAHSSVTWANATGDINNQALVSNAHAGIPGATPGSAESASEAFWSAVFTISCTLAPEDCGGATLVTFSASSMGWSNTVSTDAFGITAKAHTVFTMHLDIEDDLLFKDVLVSIGPSDADEDADLVQNLSAVRELAYGQEYRLVARLNTDALVINGDVASVPEPGTLALLGLGLLAAGRSVRTHIRSKQLP